jgi:hypothetical protein
VLLGVVFALSTIASGARLQLATDRAPLAVAGDDQAHQQEGPAQPLRRLLQTELVKDGGDDGLGLGLVVIASRAFLMGGTSSDSLAPVDAIATAPSVHECHGARPPPIA